jgi:outer membrane protein assembly factor BamA
VTPARITAAGKALVASLWASALAAETHDKPGWIALPVISYAPETSLQLGAYGMYYFRLDPDSHRSTLGGMATATLKKQVVVELKPTLYFARGDYRLDAHLELQQFPDRFYGVGNGVHEQETERYERRFARLTTSFRRRVAGPFHVGLATHHVLMKIKQQDADGLFATRDYLGENGGASSGLGFAMTFDDRDDHAFTTRGFLLDTKLVTFLRAWGSDYQFSSGTIDARYFVSTGARQALGARYLLDVTGGDAPFYQLPTFGGAGSMRGYFYGKYRDAMAQVFEAEYRSRIWWRFGAALFASAGQVGPSLSKLWSASLRPAVGGGLRFDLSGNDGFNLRVDGAGWSDTFGFYIAVLEAF